MIYMTSMAFLCLLCFCAAGTDLACRLVPNEFVAAGILLKIISLLTDFFFASGLQVIGIQGLVSACLFSFPVFFVSHLYKSFTGRPAFGGGDIKLLFMTGLFFLPEQMLAVFVLSLLFGTLVGILIKLKKRAARMPFAPAVFFGVLVFCVHAMLFHS